MKLNLRKTFSQRKTKIFIAVSLAVIFLDQLTKYWILQKFALGESLPVIPNFFDLNYIRNTGAAFGIMADAPASFRVPFFLVVPLIALGFIFYMFIQLPPKNIILSVALSLIMGGAIGNKMDRLQHGWVVDFLLLHWKNVWHYPAFNVADSAICIGVAILMLDLIKNKDSQLGKA